MLGVPETRAVALVGDQPGRRRAAGAAGSAPASTARRPPPISASPKPSAPRTPSKTPVTRATATPSRHPEMAGQRGNPGGSGRHNRSHRPRPWPFPRPSVARSASVRGPHGPEIRQPRTHSGHGKPDFPSRTASMLVSGGVTRAERAGCKTVGSAYVGSNPTPATTCENAPLAANSRASGAFLLCPGMCHLVAL
jgi:hypothetical protein